MAANQFLHLCPRSSVRDVGFGETGAAGLEDAVTEDVQAVRGVGVGVNDDGDAVLLGGGTVNVVEIETGGIGVEFEQLAMFFGGGHDGVEIDLVGFASID